eukprot:8622286-Pyramimonas_sp.AAC.1
MCHHRMWGIGDRVGLLSRVSSQNVGNRGQGLTECPEVLEASDTIFPLELRAAVRIVIFAGARNVLLDELAKMTSEEPSKAWRQ